MKMLSGLDVDMNHCTDIIFAGLNVRREQKSQIKFWIVNQQNSNKTTVVCFAIQHQIHYYDSTFWTCANIYFVLSKTVINVLKSNMCRMPLEYARRMMRYHHFVYRFMYLNWRGGCCLQKKKTNFLLISLNKNSSVLLFVLSIHFEFCMVFKMTCLWISFEQLWFLEVFFFFTMKCFKMRKWSRPLEWINKKAISMCDHYNRSWYPA